MRDLFSTVFYQGKRGSLGACKHSRKIRHTSASLYGTPLTTPQHSAVASESAVLVALLAGASPHIELLVRGTATQRTLFKNSFS